MRSGHTATPSGRRAESDHAWGRLPGVRPPLGPRAVLLWWLATALALATLILAGVGGPGPLDDPDPGQQRPGLLLDPGEGPVVSDLQLPGRPLGRGPVFLLFDRRGYDRERVEAVLDAVPNRFAFVLVVPRRPSSPLPERVSVVADPRTRLAEAVGLSEPKAGGFPVGYALIDSQRSVRYATLDPRYAEHGFEVDIVTDPLV